MYQRIPTIYAAVVAFDAVREAVIVERLQRHAGHRGHNDEGVLDGDQLKDVCFRRDVMRFDAEKDDRTFVVVEQTVVVVGGGAAELLEFG